MQEFRDNCGYGDFSILPFGENFKPEYLSEEYFEVYRKTLEAADKLGLQLTLYDEYGFPSGTMGGTDTGNGIGRFYDKFPGETIKRLDKIEVKISGPSRLNKKIPQGKLMAVVAMEKTSLERINLEDKIHEGMLMESTRGGLERYVFYVC